jgi:hypothetical protein
MQLTTFNSRLSRFITRPFSVALIALVACAALIASTVTKERVISADVEISLCQKNENGGWDIIDRAKAPLNATASVAELAGGREFSSFHNWTVQSEKGRRINARLAGVARTGILDLASGKVNAEVPFDVTVDGKKFRLVSKFTNDTLSTPIGELSGKRLEGNLSSFSGGLVAFNSLKDRSAIDHILDGGRNKFGNKEVVRRPFAKRVDELVIVIRGEGKSSER